MLRILPSLTRGHLSLSGEPVTGVYDFQFSLHDDPATGSLIGATVSVEGLEVKEGLFQTSLDFGPAVLNGSPRWLEIAVRDGASTGSYRTLGPRTPVNRAPYSVHALKADTATTAVYALQSGMVPDTLHADHATSAGSALLADQVGTAEFSSDAATLDGQPPEAFADANHTHTGAGIDDGTIDAVDLTSNPASLAKVTGGAASADTEGRIGIGTTAPIEMLDVRGSVVIEETLLLGNPVRAGVIYDQENGSLIIGEYRSGIDQQCDRRSFTTYFNNSPWQSFKAGVSGYLYRVQVYRQSSDECTIRLRQGEGTGWWSAPVFCTTGFESLCF